MALDHNDFVELSRIEDALRQSDPKLASKLSAPMDRRPLRTTISYVILSVFALLTMAGLAIGQDSAPSSAVTKTATFQRNERPATTPPVCGSRVAAAFNGPRASAAAPGVSNGTCSGSGRFRPDTDPGPRQAAPTTDGEPARGASTGG